MWADGIHRGTTRGWAPHRTLKTCLAEARKIDRCWGKRIAQERRLRLQTLQDLVAAAQLNLELDPDNTTHQASLITAREALNTLNSMQAR